MKRIYISGKITGLPIEQAKANFKEMEDKLSVAGYEAVNPFVVMPYKPEATWADYMLADIAALFKCEAIVMLPDWNESRGAKIEHDIALHMGLPIYYSNMHHHLIADL